MIYFIDTEFSERGPKYPIELISIGIVAEDGREFYALNNEFDSSHANEWIKENVLPHTYIETGGVFMIDNLEHISKQIKNFITEPKPEFWGYYVAYDWVVFCQIFGTMMNLPKGWPMFCRDIKQLCKDIGDPQLPKQTSKEHNALADARWNVIAYKFLESFGA